MKYGLSAGLLGFLFGVGLIVSGMSNPAKVIGFLDITGSWNPTLVLVMAGAILVASIGYFLIRKSLHGKSLLGEPLHWPEKTQLDKSLIIGSIMFGMGWGLAGICPGPGLVLAGSGAWQGLVFIGTMLLGMVIYELQSRYHAYKNNLTLLQTEQNG